jgi:hypothetical protein
MLRWLPVLLLLLLLLLQLLLLLLLLLLLCLHVVARTYTLTVDVQPAAGHQDRVCCCMVVWVAAAAVHNVQPSPAYRSNNCTIS